MLDQCVFANCIEDDAKMVIQICSQAEKLMGDHFDIILIKNDDQVDGFALSGFDPETNLEVQVSFKAIQDSLTGIAIERELKKGVKKTV